MSARPRVYFYCRNEEGNLQEDVITLAEGFRELGIPYSGSCDYWLQSTEPGDYLIRHDPGVTADDCDVVIVSYTWPYWIRMKTFDLVRRPLPQGIFKKGRRYKTVYMDSHDGYRTVSWEPEFREFDVILRSKMNRRLWHPDNMRPWVLGFTNRVLQSTGGGQSFGRRRHQILVNFGASHPYPHGVRDIAAARFEPLIERLLPIDRTKDDLSKEPSDAYAALMWRQTGGRHSSAYYERLKNAQAVACFCGELIPPLPYRDADRYMVGGNRARLRKAIYELLALFDPRPRRSVQWDSFRFWEALTGGCAAINIDLERYGVALPVMPENWREYVGIDFSRTEEVIERLTEDVGMLERVAGAGHAWAHTNYSQAVTARRLLAEVGCEAGA
jgi:hypothetical protein